MTEQDDWALTLRQVRSTVAGTFAPELTSASAQDAAQLVDRILVEGIVEREWGSALARQFGGELALLLDDVAAPTDQPVSPDQFRAFRRRAAEVVARDSEAGDAAAGERCRKLVDVERRYLEEMEALRRSVFAEALAEEQPSQAEASVSPAQVTAYLRTKTAASPDLKVEKVEVVPGGRSKETILVTVSATTELPGDVVLRMDRPVGILQTKAADEFAVLQAVHAHGGVPVPRPFFADDVAGTPLDDDTGGDGVTVLVMARVPGGKAGEYFPDLAAPTAHRVEIGKQLAAALAHLHAISLDELAAATTLDVGAAVDEATIRAAIEGMAARIADLSGPPIVAVPHARQWLLDHVGDVVPSGPLCLLQGDVGLHNLLVDGDRVTALVDWEAATIGPPARELAAAWPAATALMAWPEFVDAYVAAGGRAEATSPNAVTFYRVFFALGATMSSRTGGHLFRTGAKRDLVTAHSGIDAHFRAQRNLARALEEALALGR